MHPFVLLIIAHLLGDVAFASHKLALLKRSPAYLSRCLGLVIHSFIHGFLSGLLLYFGNYNWLRGAVLVFVIHYLIDLIRSSTEMKLFGVGKVHVKRSEFKEWITGKSRNPNKMNLKNLRPWFLINILDQGCHVISLYVISIVVM